MIQATIVADSLNPFGDRLTTLLITFPRYILAELNTHRMLSKNSASSRAIPFKKMVKAVQENPFIPLAWQKDHSGMQGTEYLDDKSADILSDIFRSDILAKDILDGTWAACNRTERPDGTALYHMIKIATELNRYGVTKQLANRLLEPFMWHTVLISGTDWDNFFELRCPQYGGTDAKGQETVFRSRKDAYNHLISQGVDTKHIDLNDTLGWLKVNKGQADIHMMFLAEAIWDAMNESTPKQLKFGQWHIPYESKMDEEQILVDLAPNGYYDFPSTLNDLKVKVSTSMAARTSYTIVGDEKDVSYKKLGEIHDRMAIQVPFHASPFEHCAKVMDNREHNEVFAGNDFKEDGYCRNFKGFIQYRHIIETTNK